MCDNKCQFDIEIKTLKIRKRDQAETTVPLSVEDGSDPPIDERACVFQTEGKIDEPVVPNEVSEKKQRCGRNRSTSRP